MKKCARCGLNPGEFPAANYGKGRICASCIVEENQELHRAVQFANASRGSVMLHPELVTRSGVHPTIERATPKPAPTTWPIYLLLALASLVITFSAWRAYGKWLLGYDGSGAADCARRCADVCSTASPGTTEGRQ